MRLIIPLLLLALSACDRDSAPSNGQAALERREQPAAVTPKLPAEEAAGTPDTPHETAAPAAGEAEQPLTAPAAPVPARQAEAQAPRLAPHSGATAAPAAQAASSVERGRALVEAKCSTCHSLEVALAQPRSAAEWAEMVDVMIGHGMDASAAERRLMLDYLETRR